MNEQAARQERTVPLYRILLVNSRMQRNKLGTDAHKHQDRAERIRTVQVDTVFTRYNVRTCAHAGHA